LKMPGDTNGTEAFPLFDLLITAISFGFADRHL